MVKNTGFTEKTVDRDPFVQFKNWYTELLSSDPDYPGSFSLGTASKEGRVSVRTVLLKEYDKKGFVFFTNYDSYKGDQLTENPYAAMLFYWSGPARQIRIEGIAEKVSDEESVAYFASRPRESRISAWASNQSKKIPGREYLETRFSEFNHKFAGKPVPKPTCWGGYRIIPSRFEFWQEGRHRLHDRILYLPDGLVWRISRLSP